MTDYVSINELAQILGKDITGEEDFLITKDNVSYKIRLKELDEYLRIQEIDKLSKDKNLSDLENVEEARNNLEVYSKNETNNILENAILDYVVPLETGTSGDYIKNINTDENFITVENGTGKGSVASITLTDKGTPGVYTKVTTNSKGQVISGDILDADDIPLLDASKITSGKIDAERLPSFVDDVIEYNNFSDLPEVGESGKIYVIINDESSNNQTSTYRWTGTIYARVSSNLTASDIKVLYESNSDSNAFTDNLLNKLNNIENNAQVNKVLSVSGRIGNVVLSNSDVGLENVKNIDTTNANNITSGIISDSRLPNEITSNITGNANTATKLETPVEVNITGDANISYIIRGNENIETNITLVNTGVEEGHYTKVEVDSKGRVVSAENPSTISEYGITDAYTKTEVNTNLPIVGFDKEINIVPSEGQLTWDGFNETLSLGLKNDVIQQIGNEIYFPKRTYNNTNKLIKNGAPVRFAGIDNINDRNHIEIMIPDYLSDTYKYLGIATEDILPNTFGRVTYFGRVNNIDTSNLEEFKNVYVGLSGELTSIAPMSPNKTILVGYCIKSHQTEGVIFVRHNFIPESLDISYDNTGSELLASNVQSAIDELQEKKANVDMLSSNIVLYPTSANSDINNYYRMVTSTDDLDYNSTAFDFSVLNWSIIPVNEERLIASLAADAGLFVGNPGVLNITTLGNIEKISGNNNENAEFYFKIYHRDESGNETLIGTSNTTGVVDPLNERGYKPFSTYAIFNNGSFIDTDRIVIKYFGKKIEGHNPEYNFQFGGETPIRTLLPVPVSVIPSDDANKIITDTSNFNNVLNAGDDNVQKALEKINNNVYTKNDIDIKLSLQNDASEINVQPIGNLVTTNVQDSLELHQDNIDTINNKIENVNLIRADRYLASQNISKMYYDNEQKLVKIQYNSVADIDYEVLNYTNSELSEVQHFIGGLLKGVTNLTYINTLLDSAEFIEA